MRKNKDLSGLIPPGTDPESEVTTCILLLGLLLVSHFGFLIRFFQGIERLYVHQSGKKILLSNVMMTDLNTLLQGRFRGLLLLGIGCLIMMAGHYMQFYRPNKSIYVMKRLPDPMVLHRYCLSMPLLCLLAGVILAALLLTGDLLLYYLVTPASCLPERAALNFWRMLL